MMYGWWQYGAAPVGSVLMIVFAVATLVSVAWALHMLGLHRKDGVGT
jgi:TRAP-type C4-dicarboxylate transport system permease small subunit